MCLVLPLTPESSLRSARSADSSSLEARNPSKFRGLCWDKKHQAWRVRIFYCGKQRHVGRYKDDVAAAQAYDKAAMHLYGAKAILNFTAAECLADPTEVSSFIILARQQATHQQQQQQVYQQLHSTAAAYGAMLPQYDISSTGSHMDEDETYQQLSVLESQRASSPVQGMMLGQQQPLLPAASAGQPQSRSSSGLMVWQQLQQHQMVDKHRVVKGTNNNGCRTYPTAATMAGNDVAGCTLWQGPCSSSGGSGCTVLLQPSTLGFTLPSPAKPQQTGLLSVLGVGDHGGSSLSPAAAQYICDGMPSNGPQVLLPAVQQTAADMLQHYSCGSINSCMSPGVVHTTFHQLQQQPVVVAQQQQFTVGHAAVDSNSCCSSNSQQPITLLLHPHMSAFGEQQQQAMAYGSSAICSTSSMATAFSGVTPTLPLPDMYQIQLQSMIINEPDSSSCSAAAMMASLLQDCSITQHAAQWI